MSTENIDEHKKHGGKTKTRFKESLCRADEFGRPVKYWDLKKKEHYVIQVAAKGQGRRIIRDCGKGYVEVEFVVMGIPDKNGNRISAYKKEKVPKEFIEEVEA
jgi:hypothetical protein